MVQRMRSRVWSSLLQEKDIKCALQQYPNDFLKIVAINQHAFPAIHPPFEKKESVEIAERNAGIA
jgi:hypothetical protein